MRSARVCRIAAMLLVLAGCGGDWRVEFGTHLHDRPGHPHGERQPPASRTGLFLIAGDPCQCGSLDGTGAAARFDRPEGIVADASGNLYVAEQGSSTIRRITPQAVVTTIAGVAGAIGSSDGPAALARFDGPSRVEVARDGTLYVADTGNSTIRRVSPDGVVTTLAGQPGACGSADGPAALARFCTPRGIVLDRRGDLWVADSGNHTVRRIDAAGMVTTVAGAPGACGSADGRGAAARFCQPQDLDIDSDGNLYVSDSANSTVRLVTPAGDVSTLAGRANECGADDGPPGAARFCHPAGIRLDVNGDLYVADTGNGTVRRIAPDNSVETVAGTPGRNAVLTGPLPASLSNPVGLAFEPDGSLTLTSANLVLELVPPP